MVDARQLFFMEKAAQEYANFCMWFRKFKKENDDGLVLDYVCVNYLFCGVS